MPLAILVHLVFEHLLFGDVVGHHAFCRALRGELGQIPVLAVLAHVVLFQNVDELGECRRHPDACLVLDAADTLVERLLDDEREIGALLFVARFAEIHEHRDEGRLSVGGEQGDDLILDGLDALGDLCLQTLFRNFRNCALIPDPELCKFLRDVCADLLTADVHKWREVRQGNTLSAVLIGGDLRNDLRRDIARCREGMRLFNERSGDDRSILQHVLEIDKVAVVHMLRKIVRIVEMDKPGIMCRDNIGRQEDTARQVLGDLARHIVALHGIDGGILVGILLLDFLIVAFDEREDLRIRRIGTPDERTRITVGDILSRDRKRLLVHDLIFDKILDLLDVDGAVEIARQPRHLVCDECDLLLRQAV